MPLPYSALITARDVLDEDMSAQQIKPLIDNAEKTLEAIIQELTGIFEGAAGLDRQLIVRSHTEYVDYSDWQYSAARSKYWLRARQWPLVEISTSGFTIGTDDSVSNLILSSSRYQGGISYYAGYKRSKQALDDLTSESGLSAMTATPTDLPSDIRGAAIEAVLYLMFERRHGPGVQTKTMNPAIQTTTIQSPERDYLRRLVRDRIWHHRRLPV